MPKRNKVYHLIIINSSVDSQQLMIALLSQNKQKNKNDKSKANN